MSFPSPSFFSSPPFFSSSLSSFLLFFPLLPPSLPLRRDHCFVQTTLLLYEPSKEAYCIHYSSMLSLFHHPASLLLHNRLMTKEPLWASVFLISLRFDRGPDCLYQQIVTRKMRAWLKLPCNQLVLYCKKQNENYTFLREVSICTVIIMSGCVLAC